MKIIKNYIAIGLFAISMQACTQSSPVKENNNALLANSVKVQYLQSIIDDKNPEWMNGISSEIMYHKIVEPILELKIDVDDAADPWGIRLPENKISREEIRKHIVKNYEGDNFPIAEFHKILFIEDWNFNTKEFSLKKDIIAYMPVRRFFIGSDESHQALFQVIEDGPKNPFNRLTKIGSNITYEYDLTAKEYTDAVIGLDKIKFINYVFDGIIDKSIKPYEPTYLVDNSKTTFPSIEDLEKKCGEPLTSISLRSKITSFIFIEDWYIDEETLYIYKKVKGMGFVKSVNDWKTKQIKVDILFFLFFE